MAGKPLSTGKKLLLILVLAPAIVGLGICTAYSFADITALIPALIAGIAAFISLTLLLKDRNRDGDPKPARWYVDKYLIALVPALIVGAFGLIAVGSDIERDELSVAGFAVLPCLSILIAPNAALYALKDQKTWKMNIFDEKGNLERFSDDQDFYMITPPIPNEKRLLRAVIKDQLLNVFTLVAVIFIMAAVNLYGLLNGRHARSEGMSFFVLLIIVVFGFPFFVYFVTNMISKIRIVLRHEYIVYHAIVKSVRDYHLQIDHNGRRYKYDYCSCVGIKEKDIQDTRLTLIFVPDDLFVFPDKLISSEEDL